MSVWPSSVADWSALPGFLLGREDHLITTILLFSRLSAVMYFHTDVLNCTWQCSNKMPVNMVALLFVKKMGPFHDRIFNSWLVIWEWLEGRLSSYIVFQSFVLVYSLLFFLCSWRLIFAVHFCPYWSPGGQSLLFIFFFAYASRTFISASFRHWF